MDRIAEKVKKGLPLDDVLIWDSHNHLGHFREFNVPGNTAEGMLESMNNLGIDKVFVTAHMAAIGPDFKSGNNQVINAIKKYPDRFMGYVTINPSYHNEIVDELDRCFAIEGMNGIKLHPDVHGCPIDYKNYDLVYEYANEYKLPVLIHVWGRGQVAIIDKLAAKYPEVRFLMGHGGAKAKAMEDAVEIMKKHKNVYADVAISSAPQGNVEWYVDEIGSEKILFGTDMPFYSPNFTLGRVALAEISEDDKRNILGINLRRILQEKLK